MNPDDPLGLIGTVQKKPAASDPLGLLGTEPRHPKIGQHGIPISDESPEAADYNTQSLGGLASLARDIPGGEALEAGARSLFRAHATGKRNKLGFVPTTRDQSYGEALSDIRNAEQSAPLAARLIPRVAGGTVAAALAPGRTALRQGAVYGATSGAFAADPMSAGERVGNAGKESVVGAAAGKLLGEMLPVAARTQFAKSLGKISLGRDAEMAASDAANYGKATTEGNLAAANPTPQATVAALNDPDVKPYAQIVRSSRLFKNADDATILRESYKLMSERQGVLGKRVLNSDDYKAGTELEKSEIGAAKRDLLKGADQVMPSFRPAVYEHAAQSRDLGAFRTASDATRRITNGSSVAGRKLSQNSPESFMETILSMNPSEARAATEGVLGRLKEKTGVLGFTTPNPLKVFGLPESSANFARLAPYLRALDERAGHTVAPQLGRALAIALSESASR